MFFLIVSFVLVVIGLIACGKSRLFTEFSVNNKVQLLLVCDSTLSRFCDKTSRGLSHMGGGKKSPNKQKSPNPKSYEIAGGSNSIKTPRSATSRSISTKKSASTSYMSIRWKSYSNHSRNSHLICR